MFIALNYKRVFAPLGATCHSAPKEALFAFLGAFL